MKLTPIASATLLTAISLVTPAKAANPEHTKQLISSRQCPSCDLSNAGLVMANLAGANLKGADLSRANLSRANLTGADLSGANLTGASLYGANLTSANLSGANLNAADLRETYLTQANLVGSRMVNANLLGAIGLPNYSGTAEDFYHWAVAESERDNHARAIELFNQALTMKPEYPDALVGRAMVLYQQGNKPAAIADTQRAGQLYQAQGNQQGYQITQDIIKGIETANRPRRGGSNFLSVLGGLASLALQVFF